MHPAFHRDYFDRFVVTDYARNWDEVRSWLSRWNRNWIYRGQSNAAWRLVPSLERATIRRIDRSHGPLGPDSFPILLDPRAREQDLLSKFQTALSDHPEKAPKLSQIVDWLALMQHYGTPTRFLDWSYSGSVAAYFAVEGENKGCGHAIWALDLDWLQSQSPADVNPPGDQIWIDGHFLSGSNPDVIVFVNPKSQNRRQTVQQGLFLANLSHSNFDIALLKMMARPSNIAAGPMVRKLVIAPAARTNLLYELGKTGITQEVLFEKSPFDGHSESLRTHLKEMVDQMKNKVEDDFRLIGESSALQRDLAK